MGKILDSLESFFHEEDWTFLRVGGDSTLQVQFRGDNGEWACYAQARDEQERFLFYSLIPTKVPAEKRMVAAEFLTRANFGLLIGNFELDFSDGEVRYKTGFDVPSSDLTTNMVRSAVYVNVVTVDRYLPGLMSVIYGQAAPEQAIIEAEAK
ncbi:MAG: YbjN domain-containing protein [Anaerolineales bacterium]